jgi:alkylated DNA repair dioxygenase AlkB
MHNNFLPYRGQVAYFPHFLSTQEADRYYSVFLNCVDWLHGSVRIFGKQILQPRLTAWFADGLESYRYSGITMQAAPWIPELLDLKEKAENIAGEQFNSALLNYYRDGNDSVGWHRDNEKELGPNPVICSVSLGASRKFQMRDHSIKSNKLEIELTHGSLLIMREETQHFWEHSVPKSKQQVTGRINITFRKILTPKSRN